MGCNYTTKYRFLLVHDLSAKNLFKVNRTGANVVAKYLFNLLQPVVAYLYLPKTSEDL